MLQKSLRFTGTLFVVIGALYGIQRLILESFFAVHEMDFLHFCYKFNVGITLLFTTTIILASARLKDQLGFIFLAGSFVKIGLFLYLAQTLGFELSKSNFLEFFIPYLGCLLIEIYFVTRILKEIDISNGG